MSSLVSSYLQKEEIFYQTLAIPNHKPGIHRLVTCTIIPEVIEYKVVSTTQGLSYEGQLLTGFTLSMLLQLNQKVTYIANTPEQTLHAIHFTHFKSAHISLPQNHQDKETASLVEAGLINAISYISSVKNLLINDRSFDQCALLSIKIELP